MEKVEPLPVSVAMIEEAAAYLGASESLSFRKESELADSQAFSLIRERYFSTWTTSLMGADLDRLEKLSRDTDLRSLVKTIVIQDDCEKNDPWNCVYPFQSDVIWPGDEDGNILSEQIGVQNLRAMLLDRRLCPEIIRIRDYRISPSNLYYCPEDHNRKAYRTAGYGQDATAVALFARDIIQGLGHGVIDVKMLRQSTENLRELSYFKNPDAPTGMSLGSSLVIEVTICFSTEFRGCHTGHFPMLRSAEILAAPYWVEKMLYHAPLLENLTISPRASWDDLLSSRPVPLQLKQLSIGSSTIHADTLHAVLSGSVHTLRSISFEQVTLKEGSDWRDLLSSFRTFKHLTSFHIKFLWHEGSRKLPIDFIGFSKADVPEQCQSGLDWKVRGLADDPRISLIDYQGPDAGEVLSRLAPHAKVRLPYTAEFLAAYSLMTAQNTSDSTLQKE
ncbi:hypothetical protein M438DRAFT_39185 [Aureobasidium pullulans EXF-150]|uniref:Uncharacterized protein n=1 Tax=Aureobasidium pullulans EXF-150 TaxID=1043002 RepID=A0A074XC39_AURPU|nr:uncharacterized protein M438DRAFT_39185 [Aureobasidium pullulans EXF-150]KEQ82988.1 hypothetical protein M438DRAFT_39185 [Aureobasidium pullulans EXF-150]